MSGTIKAKVSNSVNTGLNSKRIFYFLGVFAFLLFANTILNGYNMDDGLVTNNHPVTSQGIAAITDIFSQSYYSDEMGYSFGYRPVVLLSFALEHQFFGESAAASHFFNVLIFALSVMLFFKLLLQWTDEKNILFALIASLLFAVHPIHTEAVASIKNRDELLAFILTISAGLFLMKFLKKNNLLFLIGILLCFVLALLSKKSVYPMVIVFPVAVLLLQEISIKKLVLIATVFILPAALIVSEMELMRFLLLLFAPYMAISLVYSLKYISALSPSFLKQKFSSKEGSFFQALLLSVLSWLIMGWTILENELFYFLIASIPAMLVLYRKEKFGIIQMVVQAILVGWVFSVPDLLRYAGVLSFGYVFYLYNGRKIPVVWWSLPIISSICALLYFWNADIIFSILFTFIFSYFLFKKSTFAIIFSLVGFFLVLWFSRDSVFLLILLFSAVLKIFADKSHKLKRIFYFLPALTFIFVIIWSLQIKQNESSSPSIINSPQITEVSRELQPAQFEENEGITEGRMLALAENPLVAPHTKSEAIGTGAITLGEYLKILVFPVQLSFYYGYAQIKAVGFSNIWVWLSLLIHAVFLFLASLYFLFPKKRNGYLKLMTIGFAWYFLSILLFSNLIELVAGVVGERLAFTASAGFCIFITAILFWIKPQFSLKKPKGLEIGLAIVVLLFSFRTIARNADWKDTLTLMGNDISHLKKSAQANNLYAAALMNSSFNAPDLSNEKKRAMQVKAVRHYSMALHIDSTFFNAAYDKGRYALGLGDTLTAIDGFQKAVNMGYDDFFDPYYQLSMLYFVRGEYAKLLPVAQQIYRFDPQNIMAHFYLYKGYIGIGDKQKAIEVLDKAISRFPQSEDLKVEKQLMNQ